MDIKFRPHHFLCALCFQGKGYSPSFIANFAAIMSVLKADGGDEKVIEIVNHTDSICEPCPNRKELQCLTEEKIQVLDTAHAKALELEGIKQLTWGDAKKLIAEKITLPTFHKICATCSWKEYGICEGVLRSHF